MLITNFRSFTQHTISVILKTKFPAFISSLMLFMPCAILAESNVWTPRATVLGTYVDIRGTPARVLVKHDSVREDNCTNNGQYYHLDLGHQDSEHVLALILSAEATGKPVRILYYKDICSAAGYPVIKIVSSW